MDEQTTTQEDFTYKKQGQHAPRKRPSTPKVDPQLAVELVYKEIKKVEEYTKRMEDASKKKIQMDEQSIEKLNTAINGGMNKLINQANRIGERGYIDKRVTIWCIAITFFSLSVCCLLTYLWTDAARERDMYKQKYDSIRIENRR